MLGVAGCRSRGGFGIARSVVRGATKISIARSWRRRRRRHDPCAEGGSGGRGARGGRCRRSVRGLHDARERCRRFNGHELINGPLDRANSTDGIRITNNDAATTNERSPPGNGQSSVHDISTRALLQSMRAPRPHDGDEVGACMPAQRGTPRNAAVGRLPAPVMAGLGEPDGRSVGRRQRFISLWLSQGTTGVRRNPGGFRELDVVQGAE